MKERKYVLASGSPRRIEMMRVHGIEPVIIPASIEENLPAMRRPDGDRYVSGFEKGQGRGKNS